MKTGARNTIQATVKEIKTGDLMAQVKVEISAPATMTSVMTQDSLEALGLKEGDTVTVLAKAVNVLLAKD